MAHVLSVMQAGETKPHPYTIAIVANPALERPFGTGAFVPDPILLNQPDFDAAADYILAVLFGRLHGQAEKLLADPTIGPRIRVIKVFDSSLPATDANALVGEYLTNLARPRQDRFKPFLALHLIDADVAYAVTASPTHDRSDSAPTIDDKTRAGVPFLVDGVGFTHWNFCEMPGTVGLSASGRDMIALHEFGHAFSSFSDGMIVDQYMESGIAINNKHGRPIPTVFGTLDGVTFKSDLTRDGLHYPPGILQSYHPALTDPTVPSLMDNYNESPIPKACQFDQLTRKFIFDRLTAKLSRP